MAPFDYALSEHFDAFEWFPDKKSEAGWDDADLNSSAREIIRNGAHSAGMRLSVHARWQADPLRPDSQSLFEKDIRLACDLGAPLLNIHFCEEQGLPEFVHAITPWIVQTDLAGLWLSIENTPHHSPEQFNELFARLRALNSISTAHVGMCLDIGHANLASATLNNFIGFYDRLDPSVPIIHLHLHENWGDADSHLPLFTGPAGRSDAGIRALVDRLKRRQYSGSIILEQWPHPPSLLKNARDRLLEIWGQRTRPIQPAPSGPADSPGTKTEAEPDPAPIPWPIPAAGEPDQPASSKGLSKASEGHSGFAEKLIAANQQAHSWREKLEAVGDLLSNSDVTPAPENLVDLAIYLQFLGTGQIRCAEDGRHFRPAHHARMASEIYDQLSRIKTEENQFLLRKIYPWLPSFAAEFQRAEPLTRIRDIAHRNDIDSDLKREIKTTLQNKLHRCAGPEDLATARALLERVTAPGAHYPPDFVEQFKIFHEELKEFFSAHSLEQRLDLLKPSLDREQAELIDTFLRQKAGSMPKDRLVAFRTLTQLRQAIAQPGSVASESKSQSFMLADIGLEGFAFVLVSQIINDREQLAAGAGEESETLVLALTNLGLGAVEVEESRALVSELQAWGGIISSGQRRDILRYRASLLRCRRLAEDFGARIIDLFSAGVEKLGHALGVAEHATRVFCEATIRSHLIFQVSKLADVLLRQTWEQLGLPPWDVLVPGRAIGRAAIIESISDARSGNVEQQAQLSQESFVIALLGHASGDEEIPNHMVAIALAHEMPHLSHLGVRARQAGVVFVTCEDPGEFSRLKQMSGQTIALTASPESVRFEPAEPTNSRPARFSKPGLQLPQVSLTSDRSWIPLESATEQSSGGKAYGARRLYELSQKSGAGFRTPPGLVIPFGVMERALEHAPAIRKEYVELVSKLDGMQSAEFIRGTEQLRRLIQKLDLPVGIGTEVQRRFQSPLVVRSSANGEDLEGFAGAGLYDSMTNVAPECVVEAIRTVWASLWTPRAAESRRAAGVPHQQAHMAVLIQELVDSEYSFVLHTVDPVSQNAQELAAELVVGLGETLVSGASAGAPYRLRCAKNAERVDVTAFANFSQAARPGPGQGIVREILDYSKIDLSRDPSLLERVGCRLCSVGVFLERALDGPQDIEGALMKDSLYVVQARAQQGLGPRQH